MSDQERYRQRSLWLDGALAQFTPRPRLEGDHDVDVAIVGAGYTGLWTAYALTLREPALRIAVVEAETVGYGSSGRNGGFVSAGISGEARVYSRTAGPDGVARAERAMIDGIDWIGAVVADEAIDCGWVKSGAYRIATSAPQLARVNAGLEVKHARGFAEDDIRFVTRGRDRGGGEGCGCARRHLHAPLRADRSCPARARSRDRLRAARRGCVRALASDRDRAGSRQVPAGTA